VTALAALPTGSARSVVYFGTPEAAVAPLRSLVAAGVKVVLVVTRADKRRGRGSALSPSPVKEAARELGLPVSHTLADALGVGADLGVVVAYGRIIPVDVLARLPMINVHFSLLPRWRGAAPVERALLAGDTETGICIMRVEEGLDTGVVYERVTVAIRNDHTLSSLRAELVQASLAPLVRAVTQGCGTGEPQRGEPTHAAKISPGELQLFWTQSAREMLARIKLETAYFEFAGRRVRVLAAEVAAPPTSGGQANVSAPGTVLGVHGDGVSVACATGGVTLLRVQPAGKTAMSGAAWANGARLPVSLA